MAGALLLSGPALVSPARAALETAAACGLVATKDERLRDQDFGGWAGLSFDEIPPAALGAWLAAPEEGVPGGESLAAVAERVAPWLDEQIGRDVVAVTHPMVIRAIIAVALKMPVAATLGIDVAPLARVTLSYNRQWRLQAIVPA